MTRLPDESTPENSKPNKHPCIFRYPIYKEKFILITIFSSLFSISTHLPGIASGLSFPVAKQTNKQTNKNKTSTYFTLIHLPNIISRKFNDA